MFIEFLQVIADNEIQVQALIQGKFNGYTYHISVISEDRSVLTVNVGEWAWTPTAVD